MYKNEPYIKQYGEDGVPLNVITKDSPYKHFIPYNRRERRNTLTHKQQGKGKRKFRFTSNCPPAYQKAPAIN